VRLCTVCDRVDPRDPSCSSRFEFVICCEATLGGLQANWARARVVGGESRVVQPSGSESAAVWVVVGDRLGD